MQPNVYRDGSRFYYVFGDGIYIEILNFNK